MSDSCSSCGGAGASAALTQVDIFVALKARSAEKAQGEAAIKLMEAAAQVAEAAGGVDANGHVDLLA